MQEERLFAGLVKDFDYLRDNGASDEALQECRELLSLGPVDGASSLGLLRTTAARILLEAVANDNEKYVLAGAAITGIKPRSIGKGVRKDRGPGERDQNAGDITGQSDKTAYRHRARYYAAYARATIAFVRLATHDTDLMASFLAKCGLDSESIAQWKPAVASEKAPSFGATSLIAHLIPLSAELRIALDAARDSCMSKGRALYTSDLLIALLGMSGHRVEQCFEQVQPGLARQTNGRFQAFFSLPPADDFSPFRHFDWTERSDVRRAWGFALQDNSAINEIHMLLGILDGDSTTKQRLVDLLGPRYDKLLRNAERMRGKSDELETP